MLSSCILLNKFKDYVDKCLAMIDMNCKEMELHSAAICVCVLPHGCTCTQACVSDTNEDGF